MFSECKSNKKAPCASTVVINLNWRSVVKGHVNWSFKICFLKSFANRSDSL
uniref:Uncharacterized protein n=1 Tax=Anguilla anguilla TaxID=7936 RepID=A0A0E9SYB5_ANGAN